MGDGSSCLVKLHIYIFFYLMGTCYLILLLRYEPNFIMIPLLKPDLQSRDLFHTDRPIVQDGSFAYELTGNIRCQVACCQLNRQDNQDNILILMTSDLPYFEKEFILMFFFFSFIFSQRLASIAII